VCLQTRHPPARPAGHLTAAHPPRLLPHLAPTPHSHPSTPAAAAGGRMHAPPPPAPAAGPVGWQLP
jgi:hypothetical protein